MLRLDLVVNLPYQSINAHLACFIADLEGLAQLLWEAGQYSVEELGCTDAGFAACGGQWCGVSGHGKVQAAGMYSKRQSAACKDESLPAGQGARLTKTSKQARKASSQGKEKHT